VTLLYNFLMTAVDLAALRAVKSRRSVKAWLAAMAGAGTTAVALSFLLGENRFGIVRLATYGLFLHGTLLLAGSAALWWKTRRVLSVSAAAVAVILLVVAADALLIEPTWLEVSRVQFVSHKLPRPVRIVLLADLQTDHIGPYEEDLFRTVLEQEPDLVLLSGDYLQPRLRDPHSWAHREQLAEQLREILRRLGFSARLGVFAVRGNIDPHHYWERIFDGTKIIPVSGTKTLDLGPLGLTCLSLADSYDVRLNLASPSARYHVVVGHSPDYSLGQVQADLLLAGHTHGGQVRLPWIGAMMTHAHIPRRWASGLTDLEGSRWLLVSRGVGMERDTAPRIRFLCRPQLVVIDLVPTPH